MGAFMALSLIHIYAETAGNSGHHASDHSPRQRAPIRKKILAPPCPGALEDTELSAVNKAFGRKFNIVSFRWLSPEEV